MEIKCGICGDDRVTRRKDIGWDIYEGGEERQHQDRCNNCGAVRYWCEHTGLEAGTKYGPWMEAE